jgi:hypothetical protein
MGIEQSSFVRIAIKSSAKKDGTKDLGWIDGLLGITCTA